MGVFGPSFCRFQFYLLISYCLCCWHFEGKTEKEERMEAPRQLDDYFDIVHDFLYKSFRDDCKLFLGLRSSHSTNIFLKSSKASDAAPSSVSTVHLSPRILIREDGSTYGKVKVAFDVKVPDVCVLQQKLLVGSDGKVIASVKAENIADGLDVSGKITANTIEPATRDESQLSAEYNKRDFYCSGTLTRNGFGSTGSAANFGAKFQDLMLGVGFVKNFFSAAESEQRDLAVSVAPDDVVHEDSQIYVGGGFHGKNWSFGGRLIRSRDLWSNAELSLFRKLAQSTAVACHYGFDLNVSKAHVTLGASQGVLLRLPALLSPRTCGASHASSASASSNSSASEESLWTEPIPLVAAMKADSYGNVLTTLRGVFNQTLHWGLVAKRNLCDVSSTWAFGLQLTMEESE